VAVADESLSKLRVGTTRAVVNSDFSITSDFVRTFAAQARTGDIVHIRDSQFPVGAMEEQIAEAAGPGQAEFVAGTRLATALLGDSIATNLFMVGYAYQKGLLPVSATSILKAIELNGAAVDMNKGAFLWGRRAALELATVEQIATPPETVPDHRRLSASLDEMVSRRVEELTAYQDAHYARRYADLVRQVREAEAAKTPGRTELAAAVARGHYKFLATKDEYEVARLHTDTRFLERLNQAFEGDFKIVFHLAPPLWAKPDPTGEPRKRAFGPWMLHAFRMLARFRRLRGTVLDPFRFTEDRKLDRSLLADYESILQEVVASLRPSNHAVAVELALLPDQIRGYGHVRKRHAEHAKRREARLLDEFRGRCKAPEAGGDRIETHVVMAG
jgi:indolepyruvate ferredoxin oxidoreductase